MNVKFYTREKEIFLFMLVFIIDWFLMISYKILEKSQTQPYFSSSSPFFTSFYFCHMADFFEYTKWE